MFPKWLIIGVSLAFAGIVGGGFTYISHEQTKEHRLAAQNDSLTSSLTTMRQQVEALNRTVADLSAEKQQPAPPPQKPRQIKRPVSVTARAVKPPREKRPADDPRFQQMQAQLAEQQKQIGSTREDLDKAKDELSGRLNSTRDELSTTIAKNHDELVELEKRGERSYYEFQLDKSKNFDRVGPIRLSLRKADVKHKSFNMAMMVDDNQLQKKNVNLYEPMRIDADGESLEVVVNQVTKDHIQGYLSTPKYKKVDTTVLTPDSVKQQ